MPCIQRGIFVSDTLPTPGFFYRPKPVKLPLMERFHVETTVIGAGVIGLACARSLARAGHDVMILEKNTVFGEETSARNSEVVHAGMYYPAHSFKARFCTAGRRALYQYARENGIRHRKCGKLIVAANPAQNGALEDINSKANANGVEGVTSLTRSQTLAMETELDIAGALLSSETGIIDSHALMQTYLGEAEAHGAQLVPRAMVKRGGLRDDGSIDLQISGAEPLLLNAKHVINAAGLWAHSVAASIDGITPPAPLSLAKGNYFSLTCPSPFKRLIYPVPHSGGLGVHLTLDIQGRAKFGPDVEWLPDNNPARINYAVNPKRGSTFYDAIRQYWPGLPDNTLQPDYSGVRPKISGSEYPDYILDDDLPGHVMLYGIESPGLTASLAIGDAVAEIIKQSPTRHS